MALIKVSILLIVKEIESNIKIIESLSDISSSFIREKISENISVLHYTPIEIHEYIKENNLYR